MPRLKQNATCPLGGVGVGGKWRFWIWYHLLSGSKRFGELQRLLPQASRQMLTIQLRALEHLGVLQRRVYRQSIPKVEYSLTEPGKSVEPLLQQLYIWGERYREQTGCEFDWPQSMGGRWKFWIWYHLLNGNKRFCELQRLLPQASRQMLAIQLRALEQMGALHRLVDAERPPKIEYALTQPGQELEPLLRQMYAWGRWWCEQMHVEFDWPVNDIAVPRILIA